MLNVRNYMLRLTPSEGVHRFGNAYLRYRARVRRWL